MKGLIFIWISPIGFSSISDFLSFNSLTCLIYSLLLSFCIFSVHLQAKEELATWKAYWMRHFDILQVSMNFLNLYLSQHVVWMIHFDVQPGLFRFQYHNHMTVVVCILLIDQVQEAALFETLYALDCDPRQFSEYTASYATLTNNLSSEERMALRSADQVLQQTDKANKTGADSNNSNINNNSSNSNSNSSTIGSGKKKHTALEYVEAVVEVDTDNKLPEYEAQALIDPLVQQYAYKRYYLRVIFYIVVVYAVYTFATF